MYANYALLALSSHLVRIPSHIFIVLPDYPFTKTFIPYYTPLGLLDGHCSTTHHVTVEYYRARYLCKVAVAE